MRTLDLSLLFALILVLISPANAQESREIHLRALDHPATTILAVLLLPAGQGPFPAIVALHGCGGLGDAKERLSSRHADWGKRLRDAGYVVIFPDSFGSRGHGSLCKIRNRPVKYSQRIGDARAAADWLATQPFVDTKRIALLGWSNGGSTALRAMEPGLKPAASEFRAVIAFYPGCRTLLEKTQWAPRIAPLILIGAADDWTPAEPCRRLARKWDTRMVAYEGAYHGFDTPNSPVRARTGVVFSANGSGTVHVGTHEAARAAAIEEVMTLLAGMAR